MLESRAHGRLGSLNHEIILANSLPKGLNRPKFCNPLKIKDYLNFLELGKVEDRRSNCFNF